MRILAVLAIAAFAPVVSLAQSAGEVERCFQNPAACSHGGGGGAAAQAPAPAPAPAPSGGGHAATRPAAPAPDYTTVLQSAEPDRRKIQESLRTLDKYNGPIDGNLQSDATVKAIQEWQKGRGTNPVGKLTPQEAQQLNAEAARTPIRRVDPATQTATAPAAPTPVQPPSKSNADALKELQARLAERRKAAEPKAEAATQSLIRDLKAYVAADGKGAAGEQFAGFAKWYADTRADGRAVGEIAPVIDDYGDAKAGAAVASEVLLETKKGASNQSQCLVFAWIEGNPRKNPQVFSCDDVAGVEKWKTDQSLKSAWR
ncbi:MAG: peptidoglycan-binding protein [Rhodospirillales bacterium]|nr:peptidoglycan-binding protein [Rhodospirillales bacterium]